MSSTTVVSASVGDRVAVTARGTGRRGGNPDVHVRVTDRGTELASGRMWRGRFEEWGSFARRGLVDHLEVRARSAGRPGLVWWERRHVVDIDPVVVAPRPAGPGARIEIVTGPHGGGHSGSSGSHDGDVDGIRPWRDGDSERFVHWPTSLRTGDLVVLDRHRSADTSWIVRVDPESGDDDEEAGRARWALDEGRRRGVRTAAAVGDGEPVEIPDADAAARWSAACIPERATTMPGRLPRDPVEAGLPLSPVARYVTAAATFAGLGLLVGALGSSPLTTALLAAGTAVGAVVTVRISRSGGELPNFVRLLVALGALGGVASIAIGSGSVSGLLAVLRGPLPQFLMLLVVLHGFECSDRRTARVELGHLVGRRGLRRRPARRRRPRLVARRLGGVLRFGHRVDRTGSPQRRRVVDRRASRCTTGDHQADRVPFGRGRDRRARHRVASLAGPGAERTRHTHAPRFHRRCQPRRRARRTCPCRRLDHAARRNRRRHTRRRPMASVGTRVSPSRSTRRSAASSATTSSCACGRRSPTSGVVRRSPTSTVASGTPTAISAPSG